MNIQHNENHKVVDLEFSQKYNRQHAEAYYQKHRQELSRKWSHAREEQVSRKALEIAGSPQHVLDLPCGAGRFWPLLLEQRNRQVIAADYSADMVAVACQAYAQVMGGRIKCIQTSAFSIELPDEAVDCIFCMRLLHHVGKAEDRAVMLREFHRVTRETVIISLWVDGNYKAWRRRKHEKRRQRAVKQHAQNRFVVRRTEIEAEFKTAGFEIIGHLDFLPFYQMWRTYVLRKC